MRKVIVLADIYDSAHHLSNKEKQEWESKKSIEFLLDTISSLGYDSILIEPQQSKKKLLEIVLQSIESKDIGKNIFFNLVEGYNSRNREAYVPAIGEFFGIPFTGSDTYAQCISLDKNQMKRLVRELNIPVKKSYLIEQNNIFPTCLSFPVFIKPNGEGSSLGINENSIIQNVKELKTHLPDLVLQYESVLIEEYLAGDDLTLGVFGNYPKYEATKVARVTYPSRVYSEEIKSKESMPENLSFSINTQIEKKIQNDSISICEKLKISGYARLDWKLDGLGNPFFLEINLTPGLSRFYSSLPICFESNMGNYSEMIKKILHFGYENYNTNKFFAYGRNEKN